MKVLVGISGGVDSSVAALILKNAGHEVEGIMFNQVEEPDYSCEGSVCCGESSVRRARMVAEQIGIHLHVVDLRKEFQEKIISPTQASLDLGNQPAPCNSCNGKVRAPRLNHYAKVLECDAFATGHYFVNDNGRIFRGKDTSKDQSYMVSRVRSSDLIRWLTPLGNMTKPEVREAAKEFNLVTASTPDSMSLCFAHKLNHKTRDVFDEAGRKLGVVEHSVALGQRKNMCGFTALKVLPDSVIVGPGKVDCSTTEFVVDDFNWIADLKTDQQIYAMTSSHGKAIPCTISGDKVSLSQPSLSSTGQVMAFYEGNQLLGSAVVV